ncbi:MAG: hypothetical protein ACPGVG_18445 [Mycobacterium sp.]
MELDAKTVGAVIGSAVVAAGGGGWFGHSSNASEVEACGVLLQQQREGFSATLSDIVKQLGD